MHRKSYAGVGTSYPSNATKLERESRAACFQAADWTALPGLKPTNRFRKVQFNATAGKDRCQKRLAERRPASHQRNRGWITLQKIIMGQYRSALTLFAGVPTMKWWKAARSAVSARGVPFDIAVIVISDPE